MIEGEKKFRPLVDCEQSLFFSRFIEGSARARERRAAKRRDARNEDGSPLSAFSLACGHFRLSHVSLDGLRKKRDCSQFRPLVAN